jgi:catechol 2,3-dioxygenase-like lactoylglutathione lyase family enzyme
MTVRGLWLPFEVADLDAAVGFYTRHLGLSQVDSWHRDGDRGVVLDAGRAFVELAAATADGPSAPPLAFELSDGAAVNASHATFRPAAVRQPPHRYPRGHYGFTATGPAGAHIMIWSER